MQTKQLHVNPHTLFPRLPTPAPTPRPSTINLLQADTQPSALLRSSLPDVQTISIFHASPHQQHN